jgi:TrmH family RNA methyltransferase
MSSAHADAVYEILCDEAFELSPLFTGNIRRLSTRQFRSISASRTPQGVLAVVSLPQKVYTSMLPEDHGSRILLLEEVQDPGNVGTLIRTAAAFNFSGVILSDTCADPFSPKAVQSSAGSILSLWVRRTSEYSVLARSLKGKNFLIAAADIRGDSEWETAGREKILLALGNEGKGLSEKIIGLADAVFTIPYNRKQAESLNVAAAGAICMYLIQKG